MGLFLPLVGLGVLVASLCYLLGVVVTLSLYLVAIVILNIWQKLSAPVFGFNALSKVYDSVMSGFEERTLAPLRRKYVPLARGRVLDFGCGTGHSLEYLRNDVIDAVVMVDSSGGMLEKARQRAKNLRADKVEFTKADGARLPFESGSFDSVLCCDIYGSMDFAHARLMHSFLCSVPPFSACLFFEVLRL